MRKRRLDITFFFSLICSLVINSGMVGLVVFNIQAPSVVDLSSWHPRLTSRAVAAAEIIPPPPPAPEPQQSIHFDNRDEFGENNSTGQGLNSSPGDQPLQGMLGHQEQAYLGRSQPTGGGGGGGQPVMIGAASPDQAVATPRPKSPPPPKVAQNAPKTVQQKTQSIKAPPDKPLPDGQYLAAQTGNDQQQIDPMTQSPVQQQQPQKQLQQPQQKPQQQIAKQVTQNQTNQKPAANPGPPGPPGPGKSTPDSAPQSDKESDPFSTTKSFRFVDGRVTARNGRWVKTVKPHFDQAAMVDASTMSSPEVTFLATIDEQGNVVHVSRYHSSGSDNIDLPCEQALAQWQIEPSKDSAGKPVRDVISVTFAFED